MNSVDGFFKNSLLSKTSTYLMVLSISQLHRYAVLRYKKFTHNYTYALSIII
jgi:hypothetical protein